MFKRFMLFFGVNIAIMVVLNIVIQLLGLDPWMNAYGINYQSLAVMCLVWGMGGSFISLMLSKWMAKTMMGVELITPNGPQGEIAQMVHNLARRAGIEKMPEVGIFEDPSPNAFATGPSKNNSLVAVSTGLLNSMDRRQVEAVIGHEISHIVNGDMVTMTLIQGVVNAFVMFLARALAFAIGQASRGENDRGGGFGSLANMVLVIVFEIIFGIAGSVIVAWFSRHREFRADAGGAQLAGRENMIGALESLQRAYPALEKKEAAFASLQISSRGSWLQLFSTHPPLEKRILALQRRAS
ncbi:MAG: protease HtpX [Pseudomonadota bacterium]